MKQTRRTRKVGEVIRGRLAEIFLRDLDDPDIRLASVTGIEVSSDFRVAKVWVAFLGDDEQAKRGTKALKEASGRIRHLLATRAGLRYTPQLQFTLDESAARAMKIETILQEVLPNQENDRDDDDTE